MGHARAADPDGAPPTRGLSLERPPRHMDERTQGRQAQTIPIAQREPLMHPAPREPPAESLVQRREAQRHAILRPLGLGRQASDRLPQRIAALAPSRGWLADTGERCWHAPQIRALDFVSLPMRGGEGHSFDHERMSANA